VGLLQPRAFFAPSIPSMSSGSRVSSISVLHQLYSMETNHMHGNRKR
jgi:hypothetical protein